MKRAKLPVVLVLLGVLLAAPLAWVAVAAAQPAAVAPADRSPVAPLAKSVSTVTGLAISPLLGTAAYGAYQYVTADEAARDKLPWYAQVKFWLPALLLVAVCAAKDAFGAVVPPGLKKPLDILETFENKITGLVVAGAVVPITMGSVADAILAWQGGPGAGFHPDGLAMIHLGALGGGSFLSLLTIPFGVAVFAVVWMASHAINVLILLSPWGAIDAVLKSGRTALLGIVALTATINPWLGAVLSLLVIVVAYFVAGWSFRLTVFGSIFCWDFLTGRSGRSTPKENDNRMFAGGNLPGVPPAGLRQAWSLLRELFGGSAAQAQVVA